MDDHPPNPRRRWLLWLALALHFSTPCLILIPMGRDDPPDDADLLAPAPDVPAAENAFAELLYLAEDVAFLATEDTGEARARVDRALDRAAELLWQRHLQAPLPNDEDAYLDAFDELASALAVRAGDGASRGRGPEALGRALTMILLGLRLEKDPRGDADWQRAQTIREYGARAFFAAFAVSELDEAALERLDSRLQRLQELDRREGLGEARRAEYRNRVVIHRWPPRRLAELLDNLILESSPVASALADTPLERFVYKPNRLRSFHAKVTRRRIAGLECDNLVLEVETQSALEAALSGDYATWEAFRNAPTGLRVASIPDELQRARARLNLSCLRTVMALRRFRLAEGRLPKSLAELCPRFLEAVPEDLDGQPIRYRPDMELIYSVGLDLDDDDASSGDLVFSCERSKGS